MNNVSIIKDTECVGCGACFQACPTHCIQMKTKGAKGFLFPQINEDKCIQCTRCLKVCVAHEHLSEQSPLSASAVFNKDIDIRKRSSSGGVFYALARYILDNNGIVFGAVFDDNWRVKHKKTESVEELLPMLGSKYVQSNTLDTFQQCKEALKDGKYVLFSGTPCQIAGLSKYLGREYDKLLKVDFVCHGVPDPGVWERYLFENFGVEKEQSDKTRIDPATARFKITSISFRDKATGWEKFSFVIRGTSERATNNNNILCSEEISKNPYMKGFLNDLYLRESCYNCPAKSFSSHSDITLGDLWGVHKLNLDNINDNQGLGLLTINSERGQKVIDIIKDKLFMHELSIEQAIISNPNLLKSAKRNAKLINKFNHAALQNDLASAIEKTLKKSFISKKIISLKY